jgi:hypothetical protein
LSDTTNPFSSGPNGGIFGDPQVSSTDSPDDWQSWTWSQIEAAILGGSEMTTAAQAQRAQGIADPATLQAAAEVFYTVQTTLQAVGDDLVQQASLLAGQDGSPWQGEAAAAFVAMIKNFANNIYANVSVLADAAGNSISDELINNANTLQWAQYEIRYLDSYYANVAEQQGAGVVGGLVQVHEIPSIVTAMTNEMMLVMGRLVANYKSNIYNTAIQPPVVNPNLNSGLNSNPNLNFNVPNINIPNFAPPVYPNMPNVGTPNVGTPNVGTPNVGTPNVGTPNIGTPNVANPGLSTPNLGSSNLGSPNLGSPSLGSAGDLAATPNLGSANLGNAGDLGASPNLGSPSLGNAGDPAATPNLGSANLGNAGDLAATPNLGSPNLGSSNLPTPNIGSPNLTNPGALTANPNIATPNVANPNLGSGPGGAQVPLATIVPPPSSVSQSPNSALSNLGRLNPAMDAALNPSSLATPNLTSRNVNSPNVASPNLTSPNVASPNLTSPNLNSHKTAGVTDSVVPTPKLSTAPTGLDSVSPKISTTPTGLDSVSPKTSTVPTGLDTVSPKISTVPTGLETNLPKTSTSPAESPMPIMPGMGGGAGAGSSTGGEPSDASGLLGGRTPFSGSEPVTSDALGSHTGAAPNLDENEKLPEVTSTPPAAPAESPMPIMPGMGGGAGAGSSTGGEPSDASGLLGGRTPFSGSEPVTSDALGSHTGAAPNLDENEKLPEVASEPPAASSGSDGMPFMPGMGGGAGAAATTGGEPSDASGLLGREMEPWTGTESTAGDEIGATDGASPGPQETAQEPAAAPAAGEQLPFLPGAGAGGAGQSASRDAERSDSSGLLSEGAQAWEEGDMARSEEVASSNGAVPVGAVLGDWAGAPVTEPDTGSAPDSAEPELVQQAEAEPEAELEEHSGEPVGAEYALEEAGYAIGEAAVPAERHGHEYADGAVVRAPVNGSDGSDGSDDDLSGWDLAGAAADAALFTLGAWATRRRRGGDDDEDFGGVSREKDAWLGEDAALPTAEDEFDGLAAATWRPVRRPGGSADAAAELSGGRLRSAPLPEDYDPVAAAEAAVARAEAEEEERLAAKDAEEEEKKERTTADLLTQDPGMWGAAPADWDAL